MQAITKVCLRNITIHHLGLISLSLGYFEEAKEFFEKTDELAPGNFLALLAHPKVGSTLSTTYGLLIK